MHERLCARHASVALHVCIVQHNQTYLVMATMNLPRSNLLLLGSNSIQSLLPATLSAQVEYMLERHKLPEAVDVANKQRQRVQNKRDVTDSEVRLRISVWMGSCLSIMLQRNELCYVYQCIGFQYLRETLFEDAGKTLFLGQIDPRVLVSYFPELSGSLFGREEEVGVFTGATSFMPLESSIDDISKSISRLVHIPSLLSHFLHLVVSRLSLPLSRLILSYYQPSSELLSTS
jgi:hypothetical protein